MKGNNWNSRTMNWITGFTKMRGYKYFVSDFERIHEVTPEFSEEKQDFWSLERLIPFSMVLNLILVDVIAWKLLYFENYQFHFQIS